MTTSKQIETVTLTFDMYLQAKENKLALPKFFYVNCLGDYIFIRTRDRAKAQAYVDDECGKGKYRIRTYVQEGAASGDATCRATATRKGQHVANTSFGIPTSLW